LFDVLNRYNINRTEKQFWVRSIQQNFGRNKFPAGREVNLYFTPPAGLVRRSGPMQLNALEVDLDDAVSLAWERGIRGVLFQRREKPYDVEVKTVSGMVHTSLSEDSHKAGVQSALLSQLIDIFTWDVDLEKDIRSGDSFKILYEKRSRKGQESKASLRILAAELINAGQKLTAVYFEKQKGLGNYYNVEGRSLARSFLRFPLEFASITSQFSENRFHPLLRANVAHTGVDFAAARGTPVRAVGDGVITEAGWNGGYGKAIDLKHDSTYMSRYAHLDSFAEGIATGTAVRKGQVIGFVGSTGRSTGPHLHFELYKDNQYIDPLGVNFPAEEQIEPALQKIFANQLKTYLTELSSAPNS
jgi:murein DD-endopeptidase MepM/ murein hydrolase activator NlpD